MSGGTRRQSVINAGMGRALVDGGELGMNSCRGDIWFA